MQSFNFKHVFKGVISNKTIESICSINSVAACIVSAEQLNLILCK